MAKKKETIVQAKWLINAIVIVVFLIATVSVWKISSSKQQLKSGAYQVYKNTEYGFRVEYPNTWDVTYNTQVFENGDVVAFQIKGPTQKRYTEFIDGARFIISKPFYIDTDLSTWVRDYYDRYSEFSEHTVRGRTYERVYSCGHGCMTYYYTRVNDTVFGVAVFAEGPDKDKMVYENTTLYMLTSLKFTDTKD